MKKTMWDADARRSLVARFGNLTPTHQPQWGRFSAHAMVVHLIDSAGMALGTVPVKRVRSPMAKIIGLPGARHFVVYVMPFPRNAPTVRELLHTAPGDWNTDVATFLRMAEALAERASDPRAEWPSHPFFGPLTARGWGVLGYRHTDHHLRQFGV